jgi:hypothetical protein
VLGGMKLHRIGGSHGSILETPYVADVAGHIQTAISRRDTETRREHRGSPRLRVSV